MTAVLSRLVDDQPTHPGWCALDHGDEPGHAGPFFLTDCCGPAHPDTGERQTVKVGVLVVQTGARPHVWISGRAYLPEDARAMAVLLSSLGHAQLAAAITRAVGMAES